MHGSGKPHDDLGGRVGPIEFSNAGPRCDAIERARRKHHQISSSQRELLEEIRICDGLEVWRADGCRDMKEWVAGQFGVSCWTAGRWIKASYALQDLPLLSHALETGALTLEKTVELARFATRDTERKLISWAKKVSLSAIRRKADIAATEVKEQTKEDDEQRYVNYWWVDDGRFLSLQGLLRTAQGAVVAKALDRIALTLPEIVADDSDNELVSHEDSAAKRRADALYVLAARHIASDSDPDRATVVVHMDLEAWMGGDGDCSIENGPEIHPETAHMLACDCRVQFVREKDGQAVGIGRMSRTIPSWLKRLLRHRDKTCTFPGCQAWRFVHGHHVKWWTKELGETNLDNLTLVCPFHHKLIHERGWRVVLDSKGVATWYRPNGVAYAPQATSLQLFANVEEELDERMASVEELEAQRAWSGQEADQRSMRADPAIIRAGVF